MDVVAPIVAGSLLVAGTRVWRDVPDRPHRQPVDLADLGQGDELGGLVVGLNGLPVDPLRSVPVAADLQVLAQLLLADRASLREQLFHLPQHEGVALDRRGVVRFLEPDAAPDVCGLRRTGQAAQTGPELGDLDVEPLVHLETGWAAARTHSPSISRACSRNSIAPCDLSPAVTTDDTQHMGTTASTRTRREEPRGAADRSRRPPRPTPVPARRRRATARSCRR